jgi:hypothetical protein
MFLLKRRHKYFCRKIKACKKYVTQIYKRQIKRFEHDKLDKNVMCILLVIGGNI